MNFFKTFKTPLIIVIVTIISLGSFLYWRNTQVTTQTPNSNKIVRIGSFSKGIDYAPYLIAKEKGWIEEAAKLNNLDVEYTEFQTLAPINESLISGKIDYVFEAETPAIVSIGATGNAQIVKTLVTFNLQILTQNNSTVNSISDLKGKKIAVLAGTGADYGVNKILAANGLQKSDVELLDLNPMDAKVAFEQGQIDAWAVWPPFIEQGVLSGKGKVIPNTNNVIIQSILAARPAFTKENPKFTKDFLDTISKAQNYISSNPQESKEITAKAIGIEANVAEEAWPKHNFKADFGDIEINDIQSKADFLLKASWIKQPVDIRSNLYN
jgi:sulfonate transport system substrate-binding protein